MSIQQLYIDQEIADYPEVISFIRLIDRPAEVVANDREVYERISGAPDPILKGENSSFSYPQ